MAWGDGPMNSFICEIYRPTRHKHSMDTRWPTKLSGKRRQGGRGNEGATRKKGTLGPVSFRLKANQVTTLQQPFPVSLASQLLTNPLLRVYLYFCNRLPGYPDSRNKMLNPRLHSVKAFQQLSLAPPTSRLQVPVATVQGQTPYLPVIL